MIRELLVALGVVVASPFAFALVILLILIAVDLAEAIAHRWHRKHDPGCLRCVRKLPVRVVPGHWFNDTVPTKKLDGRET